VPFCVILASGLSLPCLGNCCHQKPADELLLPDS
jgi:hypothetical protein